MEEYALQPGAAVGQEEAALQPGAAEVQVATPEAADEADEEDEEQQCIEQRMEEEAAAQLQEDEEVYQQELWVRAGAGFRQANLAGSNEAEALEAFELTGFSDNEEDELQEMLEARGLL